MNALARPCSSCGSTSMAMPSTATSCDAPNTFSMKHKRGEQREVLQRLREERKGDARDDHAELRRDDPGPAPSHREEREAIHQRAGEDLEAPGQHRNADESADLPARCALLREIGRQRDRHEPERKALGEVQHREREEPQGTTVDQGKFQAATPLGYLRYLRQRFGRKRSLSRWRHVAQSWAPFPPT